MENFDKYRIRVTLVDPINWEPLDLYFKLLDSDIAKKWANHFMELKSGGNYIRENSLKTNSNSSNYTLNDCHNILCKIVDNINKFYDQPITRPTEITEDVLNYLHECYEKYGIRNDQRLREKWWDTAYVNIPEDSPFAKRWPGITFNEDMHNSFIKLNEWIHKTESYFNTDFNDTNPSGVVTYSLSPRTDFPLEDADYDNIEKFLNFGDFCLGYNTLGKNLEHIVLDEDYEALDRNAIVPQTTWSSETFIHLGTRLNGNDVRASLANYKRKWDKLHVSEKTNYIFGEFKKNREGYIKIAEIDERSKSLFFDEERPTRPIVKINFAKYTKVQNIEIVKEDQVDKHGQGRTPRWKPIPDNTGKIIEKIESKEAIVTWILNNVCTYDCRYCPPNLHNGTNPKYDWEEVEPFVDKLFDHYGKQFGNNIRFALSGGEPTVSRFFPELVREIHSRGGSVGMTTNLTRSVRFIEENFGYLSYAACSFHPSMAFTRNDADTFIEKIKVSQKYTDTSIRIMLDPEYWDLTINFIDKLFEDPEVTANVEVVYIQDQYGGSSTKICELSYTTEQQNYITQFVNKNLKINTEKVLAVRKNSNRNPALVTYEDGTVESLQSPQTLINKGETRFFDYSCSIGKESLFINYDGSFRRANCHVGGSLLGTIENFRDFSWEEIKTPVRCTIGWCACGADVPVSKNITY